MRSVLLHGFRPSNEANSHMASGGVDGLGHSGRRAIAPAVIWCAEERTPFNHLSRNLDAGEQRIVTLLTISPGNCSAAACFLPRMVRGIPVGCPFPDVADHVVQPITIGRELSHGSSSFI